MIIRKALHSDSFKSLMAKSPELDNNFEILIKELLKDEDFQPEYEVHSAPDPLFKCNCSREKTKSILKTLGKADVADIIVKKENVKVSCQFCSKQFEFTPAEVEEAAK